MEHAVAARKDFLLILPHRIAVNNIAETIAFRSVHRDIRGYKLCAADITTVNEKKIDVKCYTNTPPARLIVDGNAKKVYEGEELYEGVYVFRKVALKNKVILLTVRAGSLTDSAQVTYTK